MLELLMVLACSGDPGKDPPDTATATDTPTGTTDTDTVPTDTETPTDTGTSGTGTAPLPTVADVTWRLHDDYATIVWLSWTQAGAGDVRVEYSFDAGEWLASPDRALEGGPQTERLLGIPFDTDVQWRIVSGEAVLAEGDGIRTGEAPRNLPQPTLEHAEPARWFADGQFLLTSVNQSTGGWTGGPWWTVILDRQGRTVWARLTPGGHWTLFAQVSTQSPDHLLVDEDSMWVDWDDGADSRIARLYLDADIDVVATPGLQHAFVEHPDGTLAWGSLWHEDVESLVELAPGATDAVPIWSCHDLPGAGDCESNGLFYDAASDTYLYSFWTNHTVLALARDGSNLWWAGTVPGGYSFVPRGSDFWLQHGVSYTDQGTLLLSSEESGPTTMAREFAIDHGARTLTEVWHFDAGVHAVTNGDAWRLANGNTLHVVGSAGVIDEAAPDGTAVWTVDYHAERLLGRGQWLPDLYDLVAPLE
ncbi:MAG: hypothetical protein R3F59_36530 [Myxococcota bacterium]